MMTDYTFSHGCDPFHGAISMFTFQICTRGLSPNLGVQNCGLGDIQMCGRTQNCVGSDTTSVGVGTPQLDNVGDPVGSGAIAHVEAAWTWLSGVWRSLLGGGSTAFGNDAVVHLVVGSS